MPWAVRGSPQDSRLRALTCTAHDRPAAGCRRGVASLGVTQTPSSRPGEVDTSFPPGRSAALLSQVVTLDRESGRGDGELERDGGGGAQVEPEARLTESVPLPPDPKCV
jgi:hypothetical protein